MKNNFTCFYLFTFFTFLIFSCSNNIDKVEKNKTSSISLEKDTYNFGNIHKTDTAVCIFRIQNSGIYPLILKNVKASCGCTSADYTKSPILKDSFGIIKVIYIPQDTGFISKSIVIETNTDTVYRVLYIKGKVL